MQAYGGLMSVNGHPGQEPARVGTSIVDMGTGMWAALGVVAALRERDRTGRAVEVTTALFETALMWVPYHAMGYLGTGEVPQPQGSGTSMIVPYQAFPTADGHAMIAAGSDSLFMKLTAAGRPGWPATRASEQSARVRNRADLIRRCRHCRVRPSAESSTCCARRSAQRADPVGGHRAGRAADEGKRHAGVDAAPDPD
jgi:crotonobetainyl-CoA:carnitine CoA-transferase CaiB-like acyl-CoA transferase